MGSRESEYIFIDLRDFSSFLPDGGNADLFYSRLGDFCEYLVLSANYSFCYNGYLHDGVGQGRMDLSARLQAYRK